MVLQKVWLSVIAISLFLILPLGLVYAQNSTPQSQIFSTAIEVVGESDNKVSGEAILTNGTNKGFDDFSLIIKLLAPGEKINSNGSIRTGHSLVVEYIKTGPYSLQPGKSQNQNFEIKYPETISPGNYQLTVEVIANDGVSQSIASQQVVLSGSGTFLNFDPATCKISVAGETYGYFEGPNVSNSQQALASCVVKNTTGKNIAAKMEFDYAVNSITLNLDKSAQLDIPGGLVFEAGKEKTISFNLPNSLPPQVYEGFLSLVDDSGQRVSVNIPFRWIITGPSATIYDLDLDKSYYKQGDTAKVSIGITSSADLSWRGNRAPFSPGVGTDLINARLDLKIINSQGKVCSQKTEQLPSTNDNISWSDLKIEMKMDGDCLDPVVEAKVLGGDGQEILAQMKINLTSTDSDLKLVSPSLFSAGFIGRYIWILIGILAVVATGVGIYFIKFRKKQKPPDDIQSSPPATSIPITVLIIISVLGLAGTGYLMGSTRLSLLTKLNIDIVHAQEVIKQPINSSDANTKNITMTTLWGGVSNTTDIWGNVRDFSQNNTGGDSDISVSPGCEKINITIKGSAGSTYTCYNWGPGLTVIPFIDGQPVKPESPVSNIGNEILDPTPANLFSNNNNFSVVQYDNNGQREASFTITPNTTQADGDHTLTLQVGVSHAVKHNQIELFQTSFIHPNNCGGVPCYMLMKYDYTCRQPLACNAPCTNKDECKGNKDGCVECLPSGSGGAASESADVLTCQPPPPPACNSFCSSSNDCTKNTEGCTQCVAGQCRIPPACNVGCVRDDQCAQAKDGCTVCLPSDSGSGNVCRPPVACNVSCTTDTYCQNSKDGCTVCLPSDSGSGNVCRPPAACNVSCTKDSQCSKAADGCTACVNGACKVPPSCGTACTTKAECSGVKDGCSECLEGTCTDFNDNMCKCDGIVAELDYPNDFKFEAFGKVEGDDTRKAQISDITFRLTRDNQVVAKSNPITPQIVESTSSKVRFKASWTTPPPAVVTGATYRVFADVRCKPKKITASTEGNFTPNPEAVAQVPKSRPPLGLQWAFNLMNKLFSGKDWIGKAVIGDVMAQLASPSPFANSQSNLQLSTLNFVKLMDTDNCRFVMFKFDETLF